MFLGSARGEPPSRGAINGMAKSLRAALPVLAGLAVAVGIALRLASVLPEVPNWHAFTYDAARRAMVDVDAADALRQGRPADFLFYVGGPEGWPTLRLVVAAPAHALSGPVPGPGRWRPGQSPLPREVPAWPAIQNSDLLDVGEVPGSGAWRRGRRSLHLGAARPSRGAGACRRLGAARGQGETGSRRSGAPLRPSPRSALPQHRTLMTERRPSATPSSFPSPAPAEEARAWSPLPG